MVKWIYMIINKRSFGPVQPSLGKSFPACGRLHEYLGYHFRHNDYESLWTEMIVTVGEILV
jgi:hypothetical protein